MQFSTNNKLHLPKWFTGIDVNVTFIHFLTTIFTIFYTNKCWFVADYESGTKLMKSSNWISSFLTPCTKNYWKLLKSIRTYAKLKILKWRKITKKKSYSRVEVANEGKNCVWQ